MMGMSQPLLILGAVMSNDTFQELYDKLIDDNIKLRNTGIDDLSV